MPLYLLVCLFVFEAESHHVVVAGLKHIFKDVPLSKKILFLLRKKAQGIEPKLSIPAVKSDVYYVVSLSITSLMYLFDLANISLGSY